MTITSLALIVALLALLVIASFSVARAAGKNGRAKKMYIGAAVLGFIVMIAIVVIGLVMIQST